MGRVCFVSSRRRHTMYWRDWSADVCSSDLQAADVLAGLPDGLARRRGDLEHALQQVGLHLALALVGVDDGVDLVRELERLEIGRASCRERVQILVVAVSLQKKEKSNRLGSL